MPASTPSAPHRP
uniref:Uncharacterized protein n=1 Tax=Arundo donax TaxID=35708 RepID=A0A0A9AYY3_ARUDO